MGSTNTWTTVLDRLVADRELSKVVASHFGLDFNAVEDFSIVNANYAPNHLWNDDHVP